ncbi:unnamed protein product [Gordionus sp. m RMFG-2023]
MIINKDLVDNILRSDGRNNFDHRKIYAKTDIINAAKGSAYLEQGKTKIICSVFGPREASSSFTSRNLLCKVNLAPFSSKDWNHQNLSKEELIEKLESSNKYYSHCLMEALEPTINLLQYPKSQIEICALILEDNGSLLSALINCASLAIITSGIEVFDVLSACTLITYEAELKKHKIFILDPTKDEEIYFKKTDKIISNSITIGYLPALNQITCLFQEGETQVNRYIENFLLAIKACEKIYDHLREILKSWALLKPQISY